MRYKQFSKRAKPIKIRSVSPFWVKVLKGLGAGVAALAIINLAFQCVWYLKTGNYYGHKNFFNQDVGTLLIAAVLLAIITAGVVTLVKRIMLLRSKRRAI